MKEIIFILILTQFTLSCSHNKLDKKGFSVSNEETENQIIKEGIENDTIAFRTRPRNVLLTKSSTHRLSPIYKINLNRKTKKYFTGSNFFHMSYRDMDNNGNNWNGNFMPGFDAVYGYNMVNVSHYNTTTNRRNNFFEKPVLIKTLYYPAYSKDTLNYKPISRDYYMVSVYDEDTNKDSFINVKDLRRYYFFDIDGNNQKALIPKGYSVMNSEFDNENDYMYIFAREDKNDNGMMDEKEAIHIFWIDLNNPNNNGRLY